MTVMERPTLPGPETGDAHHLLALLPGMNPEHWQVVLDQLEDPARLLTMTPDSLRALGLPRSTRQTLNAWQAQGLEPTTRQRLEHARQQCGELGIRVIHWRDPDYPEALRHIHGPPPVLYCRGDINALNRPCLAMVGSRHASRDGLNHARRFAHALSEGGFSVVSGLALGIDGAAHKGALEGGGATVGILANGVDRPYPRRHEALARDMLQAGGLLVSELPPGTPARAHLFPQRNRLISGLCLGVLVVEAGLRSGSLITARLAMEQGREVFAVPGSIHQPSVRGCHRLIREGAVLVETVDDIVSELGVWESVPARTEPQAETTPAHLDESSRRVLEAVTYEPVDSDSLCRATGMAAADLLQATLLLEMEGLVESTPGGYRRRSG
ncbi:DNA-processing protein DprA [Halospina sp. K52047b]|uniref:DNA-processing protein DprA n=1 Tax=Halospina sp. K52047b TaxID=2614160 RepID=UPI001249FFC8|nr:DNA-processing protein DprA [Halospina sp. K52047b]KAA8982931.1 DNA-protecting protein DprA [Halospina sp. K52047b]